MQLIVPHTNADLDAIGAAVGAQVLYPGAHICVPGRPSPTAAEFISLHRYNLRVRTPKEIDPAAVTRLIIVDTADPDRIGPLADIAGQAEIHLFDHHPSDQADLTGSLDVRAMVGAASTIITERIAEQKLRLTPFQATALLLGIYSDTGSLTLTGTTARDARAAAFLLEHGASLRAVARFSNPRLSPAQQSLMQALQAEPELLDVHGARIRVLTAETDEYVGGLSLVMHRLQETYADPALIAVVRMADRVHLVGRSQVPWVDVNQLMASFGGGGHAAAASAVAKGATVAGATARLREVAEQVVTRPVLASDVMSSPVKVIGPDTTGAEALSLMRRYGHSGLPVVNEGRLTGIISLRDVENAERHGLGHAKVGGLMQRAVVTVAPTMPLDQVQELMIERDIGRVPVVEDGAVVGIISRSDLLEELYGGHAPHWHATLHDGGDDTADLPLTARMPQAMRELFTLAGQVALRHRMRAYAVGGFVRDVLLGRPNQDVDLTVEGDGLLFARALATELGGRVEEVPRFGTAHILWEPEDSALPSRIDIATARKEFYTAPAALPVVEEADLKEDLYRRDFTINALALRLAEDGPAGIVDFFGGVADLRAGQVRILHSLSFVEDPTRLIRAVRFAHRYDFELEEQTRVAAEKSVREGFLQRLSGERLRNELILLLSEPRAGRALARLHRIGALERIPGLTWSDRMPGELDALDHLRERFPELWVGAAPWRLRFVGALLNAPSSALAELKRLKFRREDQEVIVTVRSNWTSVTDLLTDGVKPSRVARALRDWPAEGLLALAAAGFETVIHDYWRLWRHISLAISGDDLRRAGVAPGPVIGRVLERVLAEKQDGMLMDRETELSRALAYASQEEPTC